MDHRRKFVFSCMVLCLVICLSKTHSIKKPSAYGTSVNQATQGTNNSVSTIDNTAITNALDVFEFDTDNQLTTTNPTQALLSTITTPSSISSTNGKLLCQTFSTPSTVTLIRISPMTSQELANPFILFNVDSTISKITIQVNGSRSSDTSVWDPSGSMLNRGRLKRQASSSFSTWHKSKHRLRDTGKKATVNKTGQIRDAAGKITTFNKTGQIRAFWNNTTANKIGQIRNAEQNTTANKNGQTIYSGKTYQFQAKNQPLSQSRQFKLAAPLETWIYLRQHNQSHRQQQRLLLNKQRLKEKSSFSKVHKYKPFLRSKWQMLTHHERLKLHLTDETPNSKHEFGLLQQSRTMWKNLQSNRLFQVLKKPFTGSRHDQVMTTQSQENPLSEHRRQKRAANWMIVSNDGNSTVWEVELPAPGHWQVYLDSFSRSNLLVTAVSGINFTFEFLDINQMTVIDSPPIANETSLVRIYVRGLECMSNITVLELMNDMGDTIQTVDVHDIGLTAGQAAANPDTVKNNALVLLKTPGIPFYMTLTGYDVTGQKVKRFDVQRVIPRMFVLSMDYRGDPLSSDKECRFDVKLRNKGTNDTFSITASFGNDAYITAHAIPNVVPVAQNDMAHIIVFCSVQPTITTFMEQTLTLTATRQSDNITEVTSEQVKAMPQTFQTDNESPVCSIVSVTGGCQTDIPCQKQIWSVTADIIDSQTGIRFALFQNVPRVAYTKVQFYYSMNNRTARAEYRSICCDSETALLVEDYANNQDTCRFTAPTLSPTTASGTTGTGYDVTIGNHSATSSPTTSLDLTSVLTVSPKTSPSQNPTPWPPLHTQRLPSVGQPSTAASSPATRLTVVSDHSVRSTGTKASHASLLPNSVTSASTLEVGNFSLTASSQENSSLFLNETVPERSTWDEDNMTNFRLAAIICGSIGGTAGMAVAVLCIVYTCLRRQGCHRRQGSRHSDSSDVTLGSSWESRSESSYETTDNICLHRMTLDKDATSHDQRGSSELSDQEGHKFQMPVSGSKVHGEADQQKKNGNKVFGHERKNMAETRPVVRHMTDSVSKHRQDDVEDITYRCVVIKMNVPETAKASSEVGSKNAAAAEEPSTTYSHLLKSGGQVYTNMLDVQKRMEEIERRQRSLLSHETEGSNSPRHANQVSSNSLRCHGNTGKSMKARFHDTPPGSPGSNFSTNDEYLQLQDSSAPTNNRHGIDAAVPSHHREACIGEDISRHDKHVQHYNPAPDPNLNNNEVLNDEHNLNMASERGGMQIWHTSASNGHSQRMGNTNAQDLLLNNSMTSFSGVNRSISSNSTMTSSSGLNRQTDISPNGTLTISTELLSPKARSIHSDTFGAFPVDFTMPDTKSNSIREQENINNSGILQQPRGEERPILHAKRIIRNTRSQPAQPVNEYPHHTPPELRRQVLESNLVIHRRGSEPELLPPTPRNSPSSERRLPTHTMTSGSKSGAGHLIGGARVSASAQGADNVSANVHGANDLGAKIHHSTDDVSANADSADNRASYILIHSERAPSPARPRASATADVGDIQEPPLLISSADQIAMKNSIEHIRHKLLQFQRRIDIEIEAEERRSLSHSPVSYGNHSCIEEEEDEVDYDEDSV